MLYHDGMTTDTTNPIDVEAMRLYVDSIDCKPQTFDWSSNPREDFGDDDHGTPWSFTEYREPDNGDEATCDDCGEEIVYHDDEWLHQAEVTAALDEDVEYDHDATPDSDYTSEYSEGPMMNYFYGCEIRDVEAAAKAIAHLPLCVVTVDGETGLALTGGGMDLSWEIAEAYIRVGSYPPAHFAANLPKMATRWTDAHELVAAVCRKSLEIQRDWMTRGIEQLDDTVQWMKNR